MIKQKEMTMEKELLEMKRLAEPLVDWLRSYGNPGDTVEISFGQAVYSKSELIAIYPFRST